MKRKKTIQILGLLIFVPLIISVAITHAPGREKWRVSQEDNIREAVFRNMMARHPGYTYFLSFSNDYGRVPVPAAFIARFKTKASVKQLSDMGLAENGDFVDKALYRKTKQYEAARGASFSLGAVTWNRLTDSLAHVEYADQGAYRPGRGGTCYVLLIGNKCFVTKYTLEAVY